MRLMAATVAPNRENAMENWRWMTAADLGRGIGAGEIDPIALTETYLQASDTHEYRERS